jgi:hypothetical protein
MTASGVGAQCGPRALLRALTAAMRGDPAAFSAVLPPVPAGLGYPAPSSYPASSPWPAAAALAPAGLTPAGAVELAYLAELADVTGIERVVVGSRPHRTAGGGPHPDRGEGPAGPRARPIGSPGAGAQARSRATEHRPHRGRPAQESRMNATIIDLQTERLVRRTARAAAGPQDAVADETCPVLLFHRRPGRRPRAVAVRPGAGPRHRADVPR